MRLDERKAALANALAEPPVPSLHPRMAEIFGRKAAELAAGLEYAEQRDASREALRSFLKSIVIPPESGLLEVTGNLGVMLNVAAGRELPGRPAVAIDGCGGVQPAVLAAVERGGVNHNGRTRAA